MQTLFDLSYSLLCLLVLLEAVVIRRALREMLRYKQLYIDSGLYESYDALPVGTPAPSFSASLAGTREIFQTDELKGRCSILLFVTPGDRLLQPEISVAVRALWHRLNGRLFVVCRGGEPECMKAIGAPASVFRTHPVKVILDHTGHIARNFRIQHTPQAIELDEIAAIKRYGRPEVSGSDDGQNPYARSHAILSTFG
jgi:hypothetical protein